MKYLMICLFALNFLAPISKAQASCNPCVCGPGGDYEGDIGEWFRKNCPSTPPRHPTPRPGRPTPPQSPVQSCDDNKCPEGYACEESVNHLGPVYQCYIPGNGRP